MAIEAFRLIPIEGKHSGNYAIVSPEDYETLKRHKWYLNPQGYAVRYVISDRKGRVKLMHREILRPEAGFMVDHKDRNRLNNKRSNLRSVTHSQNMMNTAKKTRMGRASSRFRGVYLRSDTGMWAAEIREFKKKTNLGCFENEEDAAKAYDSAAIALRGEFAMLNFPVEAKGGK